MDDIRKQNKDFKVGKKSKVIKKKKTVIFLEIPKDHADKSDSFSDSMSCWNEDEDFVFDKKRFDKNK